MACPCVKKLKKMAKSKKTISLGYEDLAAIGVGVVGSLVSNAFIRQAAEKFAPSQSELVEKYLPAAKLVGAGLAATAGKKMKMPRLVKLAVAGFAAGGALEIAANVLPEKFKPVMAGVGDYFDQVGNSVRIPIAPGGRMEEVAGSEGGSYSNAVVFGAGDYSQVTY